MRKIVRSQEIGYPKDDVHELESASVKVRSIYDKALTMLCRYWPKSYWEHWTLDMPTQASLTADDNDQNSTIFQKWIQGPSGWKCIGCERHNVESIISADGKPFKHEYIFHNGRLQSMLLQVVIWSQYEEIMMFHPFLGGTPFYTEEEMEIISSYFVPTYVSEAPLIQLGKTFKKHNTKLPIYQEFISAPPLMMHLGGEVLEGKWMTGVYVDEGNFLGLEPYLKNPDGSRTFMQPLID